mmetsp:Transcript_7538/g.12669  ORF Transcript_7538/g.12669 Transcript_7538/m.12669 type:complete len:273 (+) Transcript_7538:1577-2395(+)
MVRVSDSASLYSTSMLPFSLFSTSGRSYDFTFRSPRSKITWMLVPSASLCARPLFSGKMSLPTVTLKMQVTASIFFTVIWLACLMALTEVLWRRVCLTVLSRDVTLLLRRDGLPGDARRDPLEGSESEERRPGEKGGGLSTLAEDCRVLPMGLKEMLRRTFRRNPGFSADGLPIPSTSPFVEDFSVSLRLWLLMSLPWQLFSSASVDGVLLRDRLLGSPKSLPGVVGLELTPRSVLMLRLGGLSGFGSMMIGMFDTSSSMSISSMWYDGCGQ